jgi:hypothetical protein
VQVLDTSVKKAETLWVWERDRIVLMHLPILVRGMLAKLLLLHVGDIPMVLSCSGHTFSVSSSLDDDDSYSDGTEFLVFLSLFRPRILSVGLCLGLHLTLLSFFFGGGRSFSYFIHDPFSCTYICPTFSSLCIQRDHKNPFGSFSLRLSSNNFL